MGSIPVGDSDFSLSHAHVMLINSPTTSCYHVCDTIGCHSRFWHWTVWRDFLELCLKLHLIMLIKFEPSKSKWWKPFKLAYYYFSRVIMLLNSLTLFSQKIPENSVILLHACAPTGVDPKVSNILPDEVNFFCWRSMDIF